MDQGEDSHKAANFYCVPLQDFTPEEGRYDVIWIQWCIGQLPDDDFISFFNRAKAGLKPDGFFVLKENIARNGFVLDKVDNSVTRSDAYFRDLFKRSGLYILSVKDQKELPKELFAVKMYALVTSQPKIQNSGKRRRPRNSPRMIRS
ncbi:methyltransferase [Zea mays]|nr:methyltransferase [Zea mays]